VPQEFQIGRKERGKPTRSIVLRWFVTLCNLLPINVGDYGASVSPVGGSAGGGTTGALSSGGGTIGGGTIGGGTIGGGTIGGGTIGGGTIGEGGQYSGIGM